MAPWRQNTWHWDINEYRTPKPKREAMNEYKEYRTLQPKLEAEQETTKELLFQNARNRAWRRKHVALRCNGLTVHRNFAILASCQRWGSCTKDKETGAKFQVNNATRETSSLKWAQRQWSSPVTCLWCVISSSSWKGSITARMCSRWLFSHPSDAHFENLGQWVLSQMCTRCTGNLPS